jgi:hypothetical protein
MFKPPAQSLVVWWRKQNEGPIGDSIMGVEVNNGRIDAPIQTDDKPVSGLNRLGASRFALI